ncbi:MAG: elongation factor P, partial [Levilactobacillus sp.]|nr:elongation factor P [Levilactobacillus sp.]
ADIQTRSMQYLYEDGDNRVFMDTDNFEQIEVPGEQIKDQLPYLQENMNVDLVQYGSEVLGIEVPNTVVLEVVATEPGIKGNTASGGSKPATMNTGLVVQVPFFVNEGDKLSINSTDGTYISRA